jgi:hypothetical protein
VPSPVRRSCPDCAAESGQAHVEGCDLARCLRSGRQRLQCAAQGSAFHDCGQDEWTGEWPGAADCREMGLWCYWEDPAPGEQYGRFVLCAADHPQARPDLNRLHTECHWDAQQARWLPGPCQHYFVWHWVVNEDGPDRLRECARCGMIDSERLLNTLAAALWRRQPGRDAP